MPLTVAKIIKHYKNHPSIETINKICTKKDNFDIPAATTEEINKIIKELDPKKSKNCKNVCKCYRLPHSKHYKLQRMFFLKRQKWHICKTDFQEK